MFILYEMLVRLLEEYTQKLNFYKLRKYLDEISTLKYMIYEITYLALPYKSMRHPNSYVFEMIFRRIEVLVVYRAVDEFMLDERRTVGELFFSIKESRVNFYSEIRNLTRKLKSKIEF